MIQHQPTQSSVVVASMMMTNLMTIWAFVVVAFVVQQKTDVQVLQSLTISMLYR
jgi:hypothetical protein